MQTTTRTIDGIQVVIPVGSLDRPSDECRKIMEASQDHRGWKYPIQPASFGSKDAADDYAYCLDFYMGGHETREVWTTFGTRYVVTSKGYYHYVGA